MKTRNAALDLSRFLAAFIVLAGHFLYFDSNLTNVAKIDLLQIFHTGAKSVEYFFALSGFVLSQSSTSFKSRWLKARIIRLMPIYIICYTLPLIAVLVLVPKELHSQSPLALIFGVTGLQAISSRYYLIGANSPLWSLSVELYLSILLLFLMRIKHHLLFLISALALSLINIFVSHPILNALPYFLVGIGTSQLIQKIEIKKNQLITLKFLLLWILILFWIVFPIAIPSFLSIKYLQPLIDLFFISATLIFFGSIKISDQMSRISIQLGLRSYVLYASHAPILRICNEIWKRLHLSTGTITLTFAYIFFGFACVALGTEILFRVIEKKAIIWSAKMRKSQTS
jgi:peptidoglycan/LPS O-acetylase OafA/YrhL